VIFGLRGAQNIRCLGCLPNCRLLGPCAHHRYHQQQQRQQEFELVFSMFGGVGVLMHFTQISFYALMLLHREVFTHRLLYTLRLSLKEAFTHRSAPARALRPDLHCCCLLPLPDLVFSFPNHCLAPLVLLVCDYRKKRHKNCRCSRTKTVRPNMYICFRSTFKSFPEGT